VAPGKATVSSFADGETQIQVRAGREGGRLVGVEDDVGGSGGGADGADSGLLVAR